MDDNEDGQWHVTAAVNKPMFRVANHAVIVGDCDKRHFPFNDTSARGRNEDPPSPCLSFSAHTTCAMVREITQFVITGTAHGFCLSVVVIIRGREGRGGADERTKPS